MVLECELSLLALLFSFTEGSWPNILFFGVTMLSICLLCSLSVSSLSNSFFCSSEDSLAPIFQTSNLINRTTKLTHLLTQKETKKCNFDNSGSQNINVKNKVKIFFFRVRSPNFLNNCFETMDHYNKVDRFKYIFIDSHTFSELNEMRFRTNIFPDKDGVIRPIFFFDNPKYKK